jgi:signal transduction histidine kinase
MRFLLYLLVFLFAVTIGCFSQIATIAKKHVKSYGPELSKGGEFIYEVASDDLGVLYFATDKGVVVYDGETWEVFSIKDTITPSLEYDSIRQRLWVGGYGNFGYLIKDSYKRYQYICLSDTVFKARPFKQVWQILPSANKVTFMSEDRHFVIHDDVVTEREMKNTYVYEVGGIEYFSELGSSKGLSILQGNELRKIWNQSPLKYESTFQIFALDKNNHLLFTPYDGVFIHHLPTNKVSRYTEKLNQLMLDNEFYHAYPLSDSILAIGTWKHGVVITDLKGNLVEQVTMNNGVLSNGVSDIIPDGFGKLWAATDYGISVIDIKATQPKLSIRGAKRPQTIITSLVINNDSTIYWPTSESPMIFERSPAYLQINMATPAISYMADHKYIVRLEGYDSGWHVSDNPNFEKYAKLPNGLYTFKAKSLVDGKELPEVFFSFRVNEPWYSSLADAIRYIGVSIVFVALLIFVLTYNLRVSRNELSKLVSEKTRAIESQQLKLIEMNKSLVDTNDELDTFLYRSSHDLVAPVKSIKGLLMLMKMPNENSQTYIPMMEDRINRLELILSEINIYVKNVKQAPIKSAFLLRNLIEEIWSEVEFIPEAKKINFEIYINEHVRVESDRDRWKMIISNLLVNAIKYHDATKQNQFIKVTTRKENGYLYLITEDNGQGIKKEFQERLFEMFYRATTNSEGTGLGLFLVKKVVDSMKGTIHIESEFTVGTKVIIKVPADL